MTIVYGFNAKLLRGTAGTTGTTEVKNIKDLTLNIESGEGDATTRAGGGWQATVGTLFDASVEFSMLYDTEDTNFQAFKEAYFNRSSIALFITDGAGSGLDADFAITGFPIEQNLDGLLTVSITAKPTVSTRAPAWVDASDGDD